MPPKKTGTALMGQKAEEITKHNKKSKVKILTPEEIEAHLEESRLKEAEEAELIKAENEKAQGKKI